MGRYESFEHDFVARTLVNLETIESIDNHLQDGNLRGYEVTQLINSLLGLLVFPFERNKPDFPDAFTDVCGNREDANELLARFEAWKAGEACPVEKISLKHLIKYLRNSICHHGGDRGSFVEALACSDLEIPHNTDEIVRLKFRNADNSRWDYVEVNVCDLRRFVVYVAAEVTPVTPGILS